MLKDVSELMKDKAKHIKVKWMQKTWRQPSELM